MYTQVKYCKIVGKREIAKNQVELLLENEALAKEAQPGQFVHINIGSDKHILRRPISICDAYDNITRIVFEIKGDGTQILSEKNVGETIDLLGPLGTGFTVKKDVKALVLGGGLGSFPLLYLAKNLTNPKVFLGFRDKEMVCMEEDFASCGPTVIATDNGTYGYPGFAINAAKEAMEDCDIIYACGPTPMLRAVKMIAEEKGIKAEISMEQRMGCGIGACLVCVCKTKSGYDKVCQKGPVFDASEVEFE
ncbi:MAG: dihydroorotate dehydrogenase electron transfer subunit [Clostridia bacterium]|nr:dihydroorotate dehydrogenase electron transfer subunit [Clostridia bacterium]